MNSQHELTTGGEFHGIKFNWNPQRFEKDLVSCNSIRWVQTDLFGADPSFKRFL